MHEPSLENNKKRITLDLFISVIYVHLSFVGNRPRQAEINISGAFRTYWAMYYLTQTPRAVVVSANETRGKSADDTNMSSK